jgi:hypothetical protein
MPELVLLDLSLQKVEEEAKREEWSIVALPSAAEYHFEKAFRGWTWTETEGA